MNKKAVLAIGTALLTGLTALVFYKRRSTGKLQQQKNGLPESPAPNQALYHFFAPMYDALFGPSYGSARRRATKLLDLQAGECLLISGIGTGLDLPQIPAGVQVIGVDISIDMLQQAAKKQSQASVELIQMDAQHLELPGECFDAALLNLIVSVAPDGKAVFQEAWRVLKPGGRLVLFDKFLPEGQAVGSLRSALGSFFRWIGTDINRTLSEVLGSVEDATIEMNEPSLFFGQYRILRLKKKRDDGEGLDYEQAQTFEFLRD